MKKRIILTLLSLFIILSIFACGVKPKSFFAEVPMVKETAAAFTSGVNGFGRQAMKSMATNDMASYEEMAEMDYEGGTSKKKLIKTVDINAETKEFDSSIEWLKSHVESYDGVIDSSYVDSGNITAKNYRKNAYFNVRVPADKLSSFVGKLGDKLNITFEQESVRDVTDAYDDTESRKKTLLLEEEKLNELLKKAKNIDDLVTIESKLSEVRFELQNIENRLKRYDKQIDYSTININISEVIEITETIEKEDYSKNNLLKLLNKNFDDTKKFVIKMGVYIFTHIPAICLGLICFVILLFIILAIKSIAKGGKKSRGKSRKNNTDTLNEKNDKISNTDNVTNEKALADNIDIDIVKKVEEEVKDIKKEEINNENIEKPKRKNKKTSKEATKENLNL